MKMLTLGLTLSALLALAFLARPALAQQYPVDGCTFQLQGTSVQELWLASGVAPGTPGVQRTLDCWRDGQIPGLAPIDDLTPGAGYWCHFHKTTLITVLVFDTSADGSGACSGCKPRAARSGGSTSLSED